MEMENKTTKLRIVIHTLYKRGYNFLKEKSAIIFSKIRNFHAKTVVLAGQIYPLCLPAGRKVDISARWLLCLPAKLE